MTIYDDILRLQQLSGDQVGSDVLEHARLAQESITSRAQIALDILGAGSRLAEELEETKQIAAETEQRFVRLNELLTTIIKAEAERLLGGAG